MPVHPVIDVMVILERDGLILLAERRNTGYADGMLNLPSGKVENETVAQAAAREALEEVGVHIALSALIPVHVMHYRNPEGGHRIGWFFKPTHWTNTPHNAEPAKCAGISWHPPTDLPPNTVPYNALGIAHHLRNEPFSIHGWENGPA
ncbi:NUDIX hydrolase [Streptomyces acidiscabies]|uniref:NUDIX hydrolase n=1 Tax=Streptomyces acidiscabies TaxID=42234 RepID=UPI00073FA163|nr:NUDIX domain-containing protein [Streptomyces acidiscabies]GAQ56807.1 hypothetical protein a10_06672 [Streptomyces acidiscabies]